MRYMRVTRFTFLGALKSTSTILDVLFMYTPVILPKAGGTNNAIKNQLIINIMFNINLKGLF